MASGGQSEDTEHPSEPPTASLQSSRTCQWGAILAAVRDHLPSLGSDSSTSDSEGDAELYIYHREQPSFIPDLAEELLEFSLEDLGMQLTQEAEGHPWEIWNGDLEGFGFQKQAEGAQVGAKEDTQMIQDSRDHLEEELGRKQAMERGNSWLNTALSVEGLGSAKERRKLIKTKILSKIFLEPSPGHSELRVKPPSHDINNSAERIAEEKPSFDGCLQELQKVEQWDQGKNPEELEQQRDNTQAEAALSSADHDTFWSKSENQLREELEELCARQSRTVSPPCSWPSAKLSSSQEQQEKKTSCLDEDMLKECSLYRGCSSSPSSPRGATMSSECLPEPGAVYTDLREAQAQKLAISDGCLSASSSSSEEEETMAVKDQAARRRRNCSGKSLLLQQLHAACREASELLPQTSTPAGKLEGSKQEPGSLAKKDSPKLSHTQYFEVREETAKETPRKLRLEREERAPPVFIHRARGADLGKGNQMAAEMAPNSGTAPESPLAPTALPRPEDSKRELSQQEEQRKERHRLQEQPQQSVAGQQPMAEESPVLFHLRR